MFSSLTNAFICLLPFPPWFILKSHLIPTLFPSSRQHFPPFLPLHPPPLLCSSLSLHSLPLSFHPLRHGKRRHTDGFPITAGTKGSGWLPHVNVWSPGIEHQWWRQWRDTRELDDYIKVTHTGEKWSPEEYLLGCPQHSCTSPNPRLSTHIPLPYVKLS